MFRQVVEMKYSIITYVITYVMIYVKETDFIMDSTYIKFNGELYGRKVQ